jgi:hypothetical protein
MNPRGVLYALLCVLLLSACTALPPSPSTKENLAMPTDSTLESSSATPSVQEITQRVLALILDIHGRQDISPEIIERHMGKKVWFDPNNKNRYGVSGKLTEAWWYGLDSLPSEAPDKKPASLLFEFNDQTHADADMSSVCVPFESYRAPLIAAGFKAEQLPYLQGFPDYWIFSRGIIHVSIYLRDRQADG